MHPTRSELALYAGRDMGLWPRLRLGAHVRVCERCARHVEEFRTVREWMGARQDELPVGLHWDAMAAEMKANIRLGLAAGAIVDTPPPERLPLRWRTPAMVLPVLLVIVAGVILQSLHPPIKRVAPDGPPMAAIDDELGSVLAASSSGIGLEQDGRGFKMLYQRADNVVYSVRGHGAVRARYVDSETGQVTINHVYAQ